MSINGQGDTPPRLRVSQAAKAVGRSRASLHRDIAAGRVSVTRNSTGQPFIEIAELERAYGRVELATVSRGVAVQQDATTENRSEIVALQRELALIREERERERQDAQATIRDLRQRLDAEAEERRRLTAVLADQRTPVPVSAPRQSWWRWQRTK